MIVFQKKTKPISVMSWFTNTFPQTNQFGLPLFIPARPGRPPNGMRQSVPNIFQSVGVSTNSSNGAGGQHLATPLSHVNSNQPHINSNQPLYNNNPTEAQYVNQGVQCQVQEPQPQYTLSPKNNQVLDDVFNNSIEEAIKNLDRDLKNDYTIGNIDNIYSNNNQYYKDSKNAPNLEIPDIPINYRREMEPPIPNIKPPNLDFPSQKNNTPCCQLPTAKSKWTQNNLNIEREIYEIKEALYKKSKTGRIFNDVGEETLGNCFTGNLCGKPYKPQNRMVCQPREECQMINLYNPCCNVHQFTTKFYINQTLLKCASLDLCQFIRIQIKRLNGEENDGINNSILLDFCTDIFDLGCFKTPCIVDCIEVVIDGFVPREGMASSYKQFVTIDKESYRLKIWPPPNCSVGYQSIYLIITIQTCSECDRIWTLNLITFEDNMGQSEHPCNNTISECYNTGPVCNNTSPECNPCYETNNQEQVCQPPGNQSVCQPPGNQSVCQPPPNYTPILTQQDSSMYNVCQSSQGNDSMSEVYQPPLNCPTYEVCQPPRNCPISNVCQSPRGNCPIPDVGQPPSEMYSPAILVTRPRGPCNYNPHNQIMC